MNFGGRQEQLPKVSSLYPFLHVQKPNELSYLDMGHVKQLCWRIPWQVKQLEWHDWQIIFSVLLSS